MIGKRSFVSFLLIVYFGSLFPSQTANAAQLTVGLNITGTIDTSQFPGSGSVPDTMGGVGPSHIVELVNGAYTAYRKSDGVRVQSSSLDQFWIDAGIASPAASSSSAVLYDPFSERWFATTAELFGFSTSNFLIAVSKSSDPTSGWTGFRVPYSSLSGLREVISNFSLGINKDGIYLYSRFVVLVVPKNDLLATPPTISHATFVKSFDFGAEDAWAFVDLDGTALPEGVLADGRPFENEPSRIFTRTNINGPITSPSVGSTALIPVAPYSGYPRFGFLGAKQPDTTAEIDTNSRKLGPSVILRNGIIWGVQNVVNQGRAVLRWFAINADTNVLVQEGLIADGSLDFYTGSIAVNEFNDVVIGFNGSSKTQFASSYAVWGKMRSGVVTFSDPVLLKAGVAHFGRDLPIPPASSSTVPWGRYSATVADPIDPFVFWTFQEWAYAQDVWATQITQLVLPKETLSQFVSFVPNVSTFHTTDDVSGCPIGFLGKFSFEARLTNIGSSPIFDPSVVVTTLTNGNLLQNARGGPGGVGATLTAPGSAGFLNTGEAVDVPFTICLAQILPFTFFVDVLGIVQ